MGTEKSESNPYVEQLITEENVRIKERETNQKMDDIYSIKAKISRKESIASMIFEKYKYRISLKEAIEFAENLDGTPMFDAIYDILDSNKYLENQLIQLRFDNANLEARICDLKDALNINKVMVKAKLHDNSCGDCYSVDPCDRMNY